MSKNVASEGDLIAIPLKSQGGEKWVVAKVLFVSSRYKDVMLLGVCRGLFDHLEDARELAEQTNYEQLIYTSRRGFNKRGWLIVGNSHVHREERDLSLRVIAGNVWRGDDWVRPASKEDELGLPQMDVAGHIRVENLLKRNLEIAKPI